MNDLIRSGSGVPATTCTFAPSYPFGQAGQPAVAEDVKDYYLRAVRRQSSAGIASRYRTKNKISGEMWEKSVGDKSFATTAVDRVFQQRKFGPFLRKILSEKKSHAARIKASKSELDRVAEMFALGGPGAIRKVLRKLKTKVSEETIQAISDTIREELRETATRGSGNSMRLTSWEPSGRTSSIQSAIELNTPGCRAVDSANLDIPAFLENVYTLAPHDLQTATDRVFDTIDRLLCNDRADVCNNILSCVDVTRLPSAILRSFLTITAPAKDKLSARPAFFAKALAEVTRQRGADMAQRLLGRLA